VKRTAGQHAVSLIEQQLSTFRDRNELYQDSFSRWGAVFTALFPDGVTAQSADGFNRITCLGHIIDKLVRYTTSFNEPHEDSILDLANYAAILGGLDAEIRHRDEPLGHIVTDDEMLQRAERVVAGGRK
jgi:hypothetical protein